MSRQADFVNRIAVFNFGRPARPEMLNRVVAGGLLLPIASLCAALAGLNLLLNIWLGNFYSWFLPGASYETYSRLSNHGLMYALGIVLVGTIGLARWRSPSRRAVGDRTLSTLMGAGILAVIVPTAMETYTVLSCLTGTLWLLDLFWIGRTGNPYPWTFDRRRQR